MFQCLYKVKLKPGHCSPSYICRVRNLKFATYLKFATCGNTNKLNKLR